MRGIPVILETTSATTSSSTTPSVSRDFSRHSCVIDSIFLRSLSALSRNEAAFSKSWLATASSFSLLSWATSSSISFKSGGRVIDRRRTRAPDSSMTSIALSGRHRAVIYRSDISTAASTASSVICTRWCSSYRSRRPLRISMVSSLFVGSTTIS